MWYQFSNWSTEIAGRIVGTEFDRKIQWDKVKPKQKEGETKADYAWRYLPLVKRFNKRYWIKAYTKRTVIIAIAVLMLTNPSHSAFISFEKSQVHYPEYVCGRKYNLFLWSIYQARDRTFLGILGNFFEQQPKPNYQSYQNYIIDSVKIDTSEMNNSDLPILKK